MNAAWCYQRRGEGGGMELALCDVGNSAPLAWHFHDEVQISVVAMGWRRFQVGDDHVDVPAGGFCLLPAGVPHRAVDCAPGTIGLNLYLPSQRRCRRRDEDVFLRRLLTVGVDEEAPAPISRIAGRSGISREEFTRRFKRLHGMPPHAFRRMLRLNEARRLLREGISVADVSAATGFADQSHLGRWFRRAFGTTPARYQWRRPPGPR